MKPWIINSPSAARQRTRALTMTEMMISMGIFSILVAGLLSVHLFGLRQNQLTETKLGANDQSRMAMGQFMNEVHCAKLWRVGDVTLSGSSASAFTPTPNGSSQQGNALQLNLTTDTNSYIWYYFVTNSGQLCRKKNSGAYDIVADHLTNSLYFRAEDYLNNLKTDLSYKYLIHVTLQFFQYQYPLTKVGPGYLYDSYKLEFKVTPHCPDGA